MDYQNPWFEAPDFLDAHSSSHAWKKLQAVQAALADILSEITLF